MLFGQTDREHILLNALATLCAEIQTEYGDIVPDYAVYALRQAAHGMEYDDIIKEAAGPKELKI